LTPPRPERLFTPRFFVMCGFTFTVFLSAFQLLPTAPYRILALGGGPFAAGLFLGFLTYASALSAPVTGALADRIGKRRMLVGCGLALTAFSLAYAVIDDYRLMLGLVLVHGVFWSGLLSASAAYITDFIPEPRRAEGIGYWGLSTILAVAFAPAIGFAVYRHGWTWLCTVTAVLNLLMAAIAFSLEERPRPAAAHVDPFFTKGLLEWRVLVVSFTLFLYSFGYGGITSFVALYADANHIAPKGIFFTVMSVVILLTRPLSGRAADRVGYKKVLFPSLTLIALGLTLLAASATRAGLVAAAIVFGGGFGSAYPAFAAHVMTHVDSARRGAAFGGILAAFDTGIGTGSIATGWIIHRFGYSRAYVAAAVLAALAMPYFVLAEKRLFPSAAPAARL
jgi:MFS family permease